MLTARLYPFLDSTVVELYQDRCLQCEAPTQLVARSHLHELPTYAIGGVLFLAEELHKMAVALVAGDLQVARPLCRCQTLTEETA